MRGIHTKGVGGYTRTRVGKLLGGKYAERWDTLRIKSPYKSSSFCITSSPCISLSLCTTSSPCGYLLIAYPVSICNPPCPVCNLFPLLNLPRLPILRMYNPPLHLHVYPSVYIILTYVLLTHPMYSDLHSTITRPFVYILYKCVRRSRMSPSVPFGSG